MSKLFRRRSATAAAALAIATVAAGCGGGDDAGGGGGGSADSASKPPMRTTVKIQGFEYAPERAEVAKGGTVLFDNVDSAAHTATAKDRSFSTPSIKKGTSKQVTLKKAGEYAYFCDFHPYMKATVVVK